MFVVSTLRVDFQGIDRSALIHERFVPQLDASKRVYNEIQHKKEEVCCLALYTSVLIHMLSDGQELPGPDARGVGILTYWHALPCSFTNSPATYQTNGSR